METMCLSGGCLRCIIYIYIFIYLLTAGKRGAIMGYLTQNILQNKKFYLFPKGWSWIMEVALCLTEFSAVTLCSTFMWRNKIKPLPVRVCKNNHDKDGHVFSGSFGPGISLKLSSSCVWGVIQICQTFFTFYPVSKFSERSVLIPKYLHNSFF